MLSHDDNELLTRVGPGTPMGNLFRRFWLPAVLSREVVADSPPVRLRILGEDLVAFRDTNGEVGIVDAYCSHRRAPLFFGRNEECGIRCAYHGWKFDKNGACMETPNVSAERDTPQTRKRLAIKAYPARDAGGLVWVYMGPAERTPTLPSFEWIDLEPESRHLSRWIQRTNFMQGVEGEIDSSHISFLHKDFEFEDDNAVHRAKDLASDGAVTLSMKETDFGFFYGARRDLDGKKFWRVTNWLLPTYSLIPKAPSSEFTHGGGRIWVPIDDHHTNCFSVNFRIDAPLTAEENEVFNSGQFFPPRITAGKFKLPDGTFIDTFLPVANRENDYLVDREMQRVRNFTGIHGANEQDRSLQESMGCGGAGAGIVDRTREHLVASDLAIVTARRRLIRLAKELQSGIEPEIPGNGDAYAVRSISQITDISEFDEFIEKFGDQMRSPLASRVEATS